jgi:integrase
MPLASIRPRHVADHINKQSKTYGASIVNRDVSVLIAIFETALREELVDANPARRAERPKIPKTKRRILKPDEVRAIDRAFGELAADTEGVERAYWEQYRLLFMTVLVTGMRPCELLGDYYGKPGLRWRDVDLIANEVRVVESKSDAGRRLMALSPKLAEDLWQHRRRSNFQGNDERVFCHPERGTRLNADRYSKAFRRARVKAGVTGYVRRLYDGRHTSLTLGAASGENEIVLMTRAGHSKIETTKQYLHLAGTVFPEAAQRLENRLLGAEVSTESSTDVDVPTRI